MKHHIENDHLLVSVQQTGAEICSLRTKAQNQEFIWEADPTIWGSHAPVLFPIVGGLKAGQYRFEGNSYQLPKHGFVRYNDKVQLRSQGTSFLKLGLNWDEELYQQYPFRFDFEIQFELVDRRLLVQHLIRNLDEKALLFSLGGHPAFKCPLRAGEAYEDYFLDFAEIESSKTWQLDKQGQIASAGELILNQSNQLPLRQELFAGDALIFKDLKSRAVQLCHKDRGPQLQVAFEGWPYLGIWAKPNGDFVCIEPWHGLADHSDASGELAEKEGILSLPVGESFEAMYSIEIVDSAS